MAESTLTVDYTTLVREAMRLLAYGDVYANGTVTIAAGVVTLAGGTWPAWAASAAIQIGDNAYAVSVRTSDSSITLVDTSVTAVAGTSYLLAQAIKVDKLYALTEVRDMVNRAYRNFLAPPAVEINRVRKTLNESDIVQTIDVSKVPDMWSFVRRGKTFTLTPGTLSYDLPDDFGGVSSGWQVIVNDIPQPLALNNSSHVETITRPGRGVPQYCGVQPKADFDPTVGQRSQVIFNIAPDQAYTIRYQYNFVPDSLNPTRKFPVGGMLHSPTILAAVLFEVEKSKRCEATVYAMDYAQRLQASVKIDTEARDAESFSFSVDHPEWGSYDWLRQQIAMKIGESPNYWAWSHSLATKIALYIETGWARFCQAQVTPVASQKGHRWSFLRPGISFDLQAPQSSGTIEVANGVCTLTDATWPTWVLEGEIYIGTIWYRVTSQISDTVVVLDSPTLTVAADTTYELRHNFLILEPGCSGIDGPLNYDSDINNYPVPPNITYIDRDRLYYLRRMRTLLVGYSPRHFCIQPRLPQDGGPLQHEIIFWPSPDRAYRVHGTKRVTQLFGPGKLLPCDSRHFDTVVYACLTVHDEKAFWSLFITLLTASIEADQSDWVPDSVGLNLDRSDERGQYTHYRRGDNYQMTFNGTPISEFQ